MTQSHNKQELSVTKSVEDKSITINLGDIATTEQFNDFAEQMQQNLMRGMEIVQTGLEENSTEIKSVVELVKTKHITPQQLRSLETIVDKKAKQHVNKNKGVQLDIDAMLNYDAEGLASLQNLINKEYGKTKQAIWVDLNINCLDRKGTDPKNRIKSTQVDEAFDFVRTWGGISV